MRCRPRSHDTQRRAQKLPRHECTIQKIKITKLQKKKQFWILKIGKKKNSVICGDREEKVKFLGLWFQDSHD
jgi:hypothetical protein